MTNYFGNGKNENEFNFDSITMENFIDNFSNKSRKEDIIDVLKIYFSHPQDNNLDYHNGYYEMCANKILEIFGKKGYKDLTPKY